MTHTPIVQIRHLTKRIGRKTIVEDLTFDVLFANIDLTQYYSGTPLIPGMSMHFSLAVLAVYFLVLHACAWRLFVQRDVAA